MLQKIYRLVSKEKLIYFSILTIAIFYVVSYYTFIILYAENIPFIDDYTGIFDFTTRYLWEDSFARRIHYIFRQHNDHRIAFPRLVMIASYYIFNEINLKYLIVISSFNILILFTIMAKAISINKRSIFAILPLVFLTFNFQHTGNLFWAESSLQNFSVSCLGIASIWLSVQPTFPKKIIALLLAVFVTFSGGTGLAIWIVLWIIYVLSSQWKWLTISFLIGVGTYAVFSINYNPDVAEFTSSIMKTVHNVIGTIGLLGSWIDFRETGTSRPAVFTGLLTITIIVLLLVKRFIEYKSFDSISLFILGSLLYVGASSLIINLGRDSYTENRYKIFALITLLLTYVSVHRYLVQYKKFKYFNLLQNLFITGSIVYCMLTIWVYFPEVQKHRQTLLSELKVVLSNPGTVRTKTFYNRMERLRKLKAWVPPLNVVNKEFKSFDNKLPININKNIVVKVKDNEILIALNDLNPTSTYYVCAISDDFEFYFPLYKEPQNLVDFLRTGNLYSATNEKNIFSSWLVKGEYNIGVYNSTTRKHMFPDISTIQVSETTPSWLTPRWFNDYLPL